MKKYFATAIFVILYAVGHAQDYHVNQALIDSLKKKALQLQGLNNRDLIRRNPDSVMKELNKFLTFKDSAKGSIINDALSTMPHGDVVKRLLATQTATDTTYTTVEMFGHLIQHNQHDDVHTDITANCISASAPLVHHGSTYSITLMSAGIMPGNYSTALANSYGPLAKYMKNQMAIEGSAFYSNHKKSNSPLHGNEISYTVKSQSISGSNRMQFVFSYDTLTNMGQVSFIQYLPVSVSHDLGSNPSNYITPEQGIGVSAGTDPETWHMDGIRRDEAMSKIDSLTNNKLSSLIPVTDGDAKPALKITKTPEGFNLTCDFDHTENGQTLHEHLSAFIGRPLKRYEAIISPVVPVRDAQKETYEHWLPTGPNVNGSGDTKPGNSMQFNVVLRDKADPTKIYHNYRVQWALAETTSYKGFCTNYPIEDATEDPDLRIDTNLRKDGNFDKGSVTEIVANSMPGRGENSVVNVVSMDYAAWGRLTATITTGDGWEVFAKPYYDGSKPYITLPYDKDDNKIADWWESQNNVLGKGYGHDWDEDVKPDNGHNGDNIPLIDEYRGFAVEDNDYNPIYTRLQPDQKELFTIAERAGSGTNSEYKADIRLGVKNWSRLTKVTVWHLTHDKYAKFDEVNNVKYGRWVNYNSPLLLKTHGVVICAEDNLDHKAYATTFPINNNPRGSGPPDETNYVALWIKGVWLYDGPVIPDPTNASVNLPDDYTINALKWFKPASPGGSWNNTVNTHVLHANATFHTNMDVNNLSTVVQSTFPARMHAFATFNVTHELCHATNIAHHSFNGGNGSFDGMFKGDKNCLIRYFLTIENDVDFPDCSDWAIMFESGAWNMASGKTPYGTDFTLCTSVDDCFHQLKLK